jgi:hypothetical protein
MVPDILLDHGMNRIVGVVIAQQPALQPFLGGKAELLGLLGRRQAFSFRHGNVIAD